MYSWHRNNTRFETHSSYTSSSRTNSRLNQVPVCQRLVTGVFFCDPRKKILYRPYLASSIASWCLPIFVALVRDDELAACVSNSLCTFLLFSSLLFSIDWIIFFFAPGWFCKQAVKTRPTVRPAEENWKRRKLLVEEKNRGGLGVKVRSVRGCCLQEKANYPEKVNQVPGLKCEGAACSNGLDIRNSDRLEKFSCHRYRTFFVSSTFWRRK